MKVANVEDEYKKFPELAERREDVLKIMEWTKQEPHLPSNLDEREVILFFHGRQYHTEMTKQLIDLHLTTKTHFPESFTFTDPLRKEIQMAMKTIAIAPVQKRTPTGHKIILAKLKSPDASKYNFVDCSKLFLNCFEMVLAEDGIASGHMVVIDLAGLTLGHIARIEFLSMKKYLLYLQEATPLCITGLHFINSVLFVDKLLAIMKPFMKEKLRNVLHVHTSLETFYKFVPKEILPIEYGGAEESLDVQSDKCYKMLLDNREFFINKGTTKRVNEKLRLEKCTYASDIFGTDGNFRKLAID